MTKNIGGLKTFRTYEGNPERTLLKPCGNCGHRRYSACGCTKQRTSKRWVKNGK